MEKIIKYDKNPILSKGKQKWENLCVLNPAVVYDEESNEFKMLYRAAGNDREHYIYLGLATSKDGYNFKRFSKHPVLSPTPNAGAFLFLVFLPLPLFTNWLIVAIK